MIKVIGYDKKSLVMIKVIGYGIKVISYDKMSLDMAEKSLIMIEKLFTLFQLPHDAITSELSALPLNTPYPVTLSCIALATTTGQSTAWPQMTLTPHRCTRHCTCTTMSRRLVTCGPWGRKWAGLRSGCCFIVTTRRQIRQTFQLSGWRWQITASRAPTTSRSSVCRAVCLSVNDKIVLITVFVHHPDSMLPTM